MSKPRLLKQPEVTTLIDALESAVSQLYDEADTVRHASYAVKAKAKKAALVEAAGNIKARANIVARLIEEINRGRAVSIGGDA